MKIVQALLLIFYKKESLKQLKIKQRTKMRISKHVISTLGASLLRNLLTGKTILRAGSRTEKGKRIVRAGYGNEMDL